MARFASTRHTAPKRSGVLALHVLLLASACGGAPDATHAESKRPVAFIAGAGVSDTIDAQHRVHLIVRALDNAGAPLHGAVLALQVSPAPPNPQSADGFTGSLTQTLLTTDAQGLASTDLQLGTIAGTWYVVAQDFQRGALDSLAFTVRPGAPARVALAAPDTALFVGSSYQLVGATSDRRGNPANSTVTCTADSGADVASITPAGRVTGLTIGRSRFLVRIGTGQSIERARVTVVPPGKLAAVSLDGLTVVNMDGSNARTIVPGRFFQYLFPSWSPDGNYVAYNSPDPSAGALYRVDMHGAVVALTGAAAMPSESWPRYSPDGQFIYFSGGYYPDSIDTYRMRADGTGPRVRVTPARLGSTRYWKASPSPDGTLLAYSEAGFRLHVLNLQSGVDQIMPGLEEAEAPRFSPSGQWIAFSNGFLHSIELIRVDGTGWRVLVSGFNSADKWGHDWSPDGEWIVFSVSGGLSIARVSDGLILQLPFGKSLYAASWHQ